MRSHTVYHSDGTKTVLEGRPPVYGYDDSERMTIEGTQGEQVLREYRELEASGKLKRERMNDSPDRVKRAWADEVTGRFK